MFSYISPRNYLVEQDKNHIFMVCCSVAPAGVDVVFVEFRRAPDSVLFCISSNNFNIFLDSDVEMHQIKMLATLAKY